MSSKEVIVSISLGGENIRVGKLWFHIRGKRESASFEYDKKWLEHPEKFALEPVLKLTEGTFHTGNNLSLFGAIGDSAPDRWGRILMRRVAASEDKSQNKAPTTLFEVDYLLGVNDEAREGALRFSVEPNESDFLAPQNKNTIPLLVSLPKLLSATERFLSDDESVQDLKLLLASGSSLGGARPKASVRDKDGSLAIAKFPRRDDEFNIVLWEAVALTMDGAGWHKSKGLKVPKNIVIFFREEFYGRNDINADAIGAFKIELKKAVHKYNSYRPHFNLNGLTPFEYTHQILAA